MFTYRAVPQCSTWLQTTKRRNEATPYLDYKKFRKRIGFFICNERNLINVSAQMKVMGLLSSFSRVRIKENRNYDKHRSHKMFNLLLLANSSNIFWIRKDHREIGNQTLNASSRKILAYAIRKVSRENFSEMEEGSKHYFCSTVLKSLGIPENKWENYGVSNRFSISIGLLSKVSRWVHLKKFSKKLSVYICNECNLDVSQYTRLMSMIEQIRRLVKTDENNDQHNVCHEMGDSLLKCNMNDCCDLGNIKIERRKLLANDLMKVFRETVPRLKGGTKNYFARMALLILGIPKDKWNIFYVY